MEKYADWLSRQTLERQEASAYLGALSRRLGMESDKAPFSDECEELHEKIAAYYKEYPNDN